MRRYSLQEIDDLRTATGIRISFGPGAYGLVTSGRFHAWQSEEVKRESASIVEKQVQTYMMAGITAKDLEDEVAYPSAGLRTITVQSYQV